MYIHTGEGNGTPLQDSCLENPMDGGAWWATVHGVMKSQTRLNDFTFTFHFHALEKEMAIHSSVLAWRIPGMGEPGELPSMGSQSRTRLKRLSSSSSTHTHTHTHKCSLSLLDVCAAKPQPRSAGCVPLGPVASRAPNHGACTAAAQACSRLEMLGPPPTLS